MKDKFILSYENVLAVCNKVLLKYPKVKAEIEKSPNKDSNSCYVKFYLDNVSNAVRVSDHNTRLTGIGGGIRNIVVDKHTTQGMVFNIMLEALVALERKAYRVRINSLFAEISKLKKGDNNENT